MSEQASIDSFLCEFDANTRAKMRFDKSMSPERKNTHVLYSHTNNRGQVCEYHLSRQLFSHLAAHAKAYTVPMLIKLINTDPMVRALISSDLGAEIGPISAAEYGSIVAALLQEEVINNLCCPGESAPDTFYTVAIEEWHKTHLEEANK